MLPLAGEQPPTNPSDLADSLQRGLAQQGVTASVKADGTWPALSSLEIQLSRIALPKSLPKASAETSFTIAQLNLNGTPVEVEGVPATIDAQFSNLTCAFGRVDGGPWQLVIQSAGAGKLGAEAATTDIEETVHRIVAELASNQGATVKSTKLDLTAVTPRCVKFEFHCTAKIFIATATLTVGGQMDIDDQLNARLSNLAVMGEGIIASMAQSMIQPRLAEWNGRVVPLGDYVAAGLTVSDLRITTGEKVRLEATFAPAKHGMM
jgi:hypothetical protein